jgi:ribosomal protein S18 acetylase RimI-like enzyme
MIRKATTKDVKAIIEIIKLVHIKNIKNIDNGFLMSENLSKSFYENMINNYDYCYVCEIENKIVGFLIAYSSGFMDKTDELGSYLINSYSNEEFIYIFQVAVSPSYQMQNIGTSLYLELFNKAKIKNFRVITSKSPLNKASRLFHQKLGFKDEAIFKWKSGNESYVYSLKQ